MKRGFTLIELSIVLIIIGLLVGGVLVGRDLIAQAELYATGRQVTEYRTAVRTFQLKYGDGVWPGDWDEASSYFSGAFDGDGDGMVQMGDTSTATQQERIAFWEHLSLAGLIDGTYTGILGTDPDLELNPDNMPAAPLDGGYFGVWHYEDPATIYGISARALGNYLLLGIPRAFDGSGNPQVEFLSAQQAQNLDIKIDDGGAGTGHTLAVAGRVAGSNDWGDNCVVDTSPPIEYDFSTDAPACRMYFSFTK